MEIKKYLTERDTDGFNAWVDKLHTFIEKKPSVSSSDVKNITFILTEDCNLRCTYCYMIGKNHTNKMTKETGRKAVDFILNDDIMNGYIDSKETPFIILDFIGGEPLINIEVMNDIVEYFKFQTSKLNHIWATNYMISMASNGILYDSPEFQDFLNRNDGRVSIGITIDGTKELHNSCRIYPSGEGSYDDVKRNVKLWVKQTNGNATTKVTLAPENLQYLNDSIIHLWNLGIKNVPANVVFEDVWNDVKYSKLFYSQLKSLADKILNEKLYDKYYTTLFSENIGSKVPEEDNNNYCGGNGQMLSIGTDGTLYPCTRYAKYTLSSPERKPITIGHINTGINVECDELKCLNCITRRSQSTDECFYCPIGQGCAWCSALNYDLYGTADKRATNICEMHKARVLANVYYWNKIYNLFNENKTFKMNVPKDWALKIISEDEYNMLVNLAE